MPEVFLSAKLLKNDAERQNQADRAEPQQQTGQKQQPARDSEEKIADFLFIFDLLRQIVGFRTEQINPESVEKSPARMRNQMRDVFERLRLPRQPQFFSEPQIFQMISLAVGGEITMQKRESGWKTEEKKRGVNIKSKIRIGERFFRRADHFRAFVGGAEEKI